MKGIKYHAVITENIVSWAEIIHKILSIDKGHIGNKFQNPGNKEIPEASKGKGGNVTCGLSIENSLGLSKD